ncbi:hypothetical protein DFH11DRAFT_1708782 [Phellopilus nigrolimitatus]|nr:hypothetical protein DFH11DRAFT_1708782 [Phellopilus nigrolimitatus]
MSDSALYERPGGHPNAFSRQLYDRSPARPSMSLIMTQRRSLSSLPFDILLNIAELLEADEIVTLEKVCRSLRDFARSRSIWLKLAANMLDMCQPLPVNGFQRIWELNTPALSELVRHGRRLQHSWAKRSPKLIVPYKTIAAPKDEDIVWLSPITSKYTLCCTKGGKVMCWDVVKGECVAEWHSGADWEIWKCRVEFEERIVYFAMAKRVLTGNGTDCQLMALSFPSEVDGNLPSKPSFSQLSFFYFPGHVISVYLLDPLRRLLSAYIWIESTNTLGLYVLMDWAVPVYVFLNTGIPCDPLREWSCIGYDPENVVIHAEELQEEEEDRGFQFFYPYSFLQSLGSLHPPTSMRPSLVPPPRAIVHPFKRNHHPFGRYASQSAHFVRQWWPTLPHAEGIRRRSCTIILLTKRVPDPDPDDPAELPPDQPPPGTHLFTIAQHYFSVPLRTEQLRWWYVREPFEIVCFPHVLPGGAPAFVQENAAVMEDPAIGAFAELAAADVYAGTGVDAGVTGNADVPAADTANVANDAPAPEHGPDAQPEDEFIEDGDGVHVIPLIAVDFGCAVWLEYVHFGSDDKRLRFVTFPPVDADRTAEGFGYLSNDTDVRTLDVPPEIDLSKVCHIGIDQAQGTIILGLCTGFVYIMRYE